MNKVSKDPFGGIKGDATFKTSSPFKIDKEEALKQIQKSINNWKKKKIKKTFLGKFINRQTNETVRSYHWEYTDVSKKFVNIHLYWSNKILRTLFNVPLRQVNRSLTGLKKFYKNISSVKPDLSNPDILLCYNQTAKNYKLPLKKITFKDQIEVKHLNPFEGISGNPKINITNALSKDKLVAMKDIEISIEIFEQISKKNISKPMNLKKPKNFSQNFKTSPDYFDIYLFWGGTLIREIKRVSKDKAKKALISLKDFISEFNIFNPDLKDPIVKKMYLASKEKHRPKKNSNKKLLSVSEGGMSYWSYKQHKWITGQFDKKENKFIPPKKNL